jgi:hypothetical protein
MRGIVCFMANNHEPDDPPQANNDDGDEFDGEHPYAAGINGLLDAVANVIEKERFVDAFSGWVDSRAEKVKTARLPRKQPAFFLVPSLDTGSAGSKRRGNRKHGDQLARRNHKHWHDASQRYRGGWVCCVGDKDTRF